MKKLVFIAATAAFALSLGSVTFADARSADRMSGNSMSSAPAPGTVAPGQVVLVNDGSCGKGKIKQIVGGNNRAGIKRKTNCVSY